MVRKMYHMHVFGLVPLVSGILTRMPWGYGFWDVLDDMYLSL